MNNIKKTIFKTGFEDELPPEGFSISSTRISTGVGTLDIEGGEPGESITLDFTMDSVGTFNSLNFSDTLPIPVVLDITHLNRTGTLVLDGSGNGTSNYLFDPTSADRACLVTVTARSSGLPEGVGDSTNII